MVEKLSQTKGKTRGRAISGKSEDEYLLDGLEKYISRLAQDNFDSSSEEMIDFEAIEEEILENDSFEGIGRLEESVKNSNLKPNGLSGWNSKMASRTYALDFAGNRVWVEIGGHFEPPKGRTAVSYEIVDPEGKDFYKAEDTHTLREDVVFL